MDDQDLKREWIERILGFHFSSQTGTDPSSEAGTDPATAAPKAADLIPTLNSMRLAIAKVAGPNEDAMAKLGDEIAALIAAGDLAAAGRLMDELSHMILGAQQEKDAKDLQKQLDRERKRLDSAGLVGPPLRELTALADATQAAIDAKDAKKAKAALRKLIGELDSVAPATIGAEAAEDEPEAASDASAEDDLASRLDDLAVQASLLPKAARASLTRQLEQVRAKPDAESLDALEAALALASASARVDEAQREAGNTVTFRVLQKQWIAAEDKAQKALAQLVDALVNDPDLQDDERFGELQGQARALADLIPDDGGKLIIALGDLDDANDATRGKALDAAKAALSDYRRDLDGADDLDTLQGIGAEEYGIPPFFDALQTSLADLDGQLSKRA